MEYLDDSLLIGETARICLNNVTDIVNLLRSLGFTIHPDNSVLRLHNRFIEIMIIAPHYCRAIKI